MRTQLVPRPMICLLVAASVSALLPACATPQLKEPIGSLQASLSSASTTLGAFYGQLNGLERELYLSNAAWSGAEVLWQEKGEPTALQGQFSPAAIRARLDALALLSAWAEKLAAVAGSESPSQFNTSMAGLGAAFTALPATFTQLGATDGPSLEYVGPVTSLVASFGELVIGRERDLAVQKAIQDGSPAVSNILRLLYQDMVTLEQVQLSGLKLLFAEQVALYNANRGNMTIPQREEALTRLKACVERYELMSTNNPSRLVQAIQSAQEALNRYATSPQKAGDLASLSNRMSSLSRQVKVAADAMSTLQALGGSDVH